MEFYSKFCYAREKYFESMQEMKDLILSELDRNNGEIILPRFDDIGETPDSVWTTLHVYVTPLKGEITGIYKGDKDKVIIESVDEYGNAMLSSTMFPDNHIDVCDFITIYRYFEDKKMRSSMINN